MTTIHEIFGLVEGASLYGSLRQSSRRGLLHRSLVLLLIVLSEGLLYTRR
jgi:hypothetical protein